MGRLDLLDPQRDEDRDRLRVVGAGELVTHDCSVPLCERTAKSNRGRYAYLCDTHKAEKVQAKRDAAARADGYERKVRALLPLARKLGRARDTAQAAVSELAAAKTAWVRAVEELPV